MAFLDNETMRLTGNRVAATVIDTVGLARKLLGRQPANLAALSYRFATDARPCHRALPDAEATAEILLCLIGMAQERGARTVADLVELSATRPRRVHRKRNLAFGAPQRPGVYLFRDAHDQVLYVGRARDLRARLRSYFRSDKQRPAVESALGALHRIEWRVLGSEFEAALEELRLIRELRPPANARSARPDRYVYLRRRGDSVVCSSTPGPLGPLKSRRRAQLAARALQGVEWDSRRRCAAEAAAKLKRLARDLRFEDAARLRDRIEALEHVVRELRRIEQLRGLAVCVVTPGRAGGDAPGDVHRARPGRVRPPVARAARARVAGGPGGRGAGRADARPGGGGRAAGRRDVPAPSAAGAGGDPARTLHVMDELRARALGTGWRKLVADGVTATPVTLRRGDAVKIVDGPRTETVPLADWPARLDGLLERRDERAPALARRRRACAADEEGPLARLEREAVVGSAASSEQHDRAPQHPLPAGHPLFAATKSSRDKERQVQHYVELLRAAAALGPRADPRRRRRLRQGVHEPRARRLRPRGRDARRARRPRQQRSR